MKMPQRVAASLSPMQVRYPRELRCDLLPPTFALLA